MQWGRLGPLAPLPPHLRPPCPGPHFLCRVLPCVIPCPACPLSSHLRNRDRPGLTGMGWETLPPSLRAPSGEKPASPPLPRPHRRKRPLVSQRQRCLRASWKDLSSPQEKRSRSVAKFVLPLRASEVKVRSGSGQGVSKISPGCREGCPAASHMAFASSGLSSARQYLAGQTGAFCRQVPRKMTPLRAWPQPSARHADPRSLPVPLPVPQ